MPILKSIISRFKGQTPKDQVPPVEINNPNLLRIVPKIKDYKLDTVYIATKRSCPHCSVYNRKVYSVYGWNKEYPRIPDDLLKPCCPSCGGSFGFTFYFPELNSKVT